MSNPPPALPWMMESIGAVLLLVAIALLSRAIVLLVRLLRIPRYGACYRCAFSTAGLTERSPCPECGANLSTASGVGYRVRLKRSISGFAVGATLAAASGLFMWPPMAVRSVLPASVLRARVFVELALENRPGPALDWYAREFTTLLERDRDPGWLWTSRWFCDRLAAVGMVERLSVEGESVLFQALAQDMFSEEAASRLLESRLGSVVIIKGSASAASASADPLERFLNLQLILDPRPLEHGVVYLTDRPALRLHVLSARIITPLGPRQMLRLEDGPVPALREMLTHWPREESRVRTSRLWQSIELSPIDPYSQLSLFSVDDLAIEYRIIVTSDAADRRPSHYAGGIESKYVEYEGALTVRATDLLSGVVRGKASFRRADPDWHDRHPYASRWLASW